MDASQVLECIQHIVFWCSIATLFLAGIERSVNKFYPGSSAAKLVSFAADIVGQFGALNLRDKIVNGSAKQPEQAKGQSA